MTFASPQQIADLLKRGATPEAKNRYGLPVIFTAAKRGDTAILDLLIKAGADVNSQIGTSFNDDGVGYSGTADGTPLSYAAGAGKLDAVKALKAAGADLNGAGPEGTTALVTAAEGNHLEIVQWLLENGSSKGRAQAVTVAQRFINPDETRQQIIQLLQAGQ
jgi:ankyrin repeat protein